jgi:hypothetical protein
MNSRTSRKCIIPEAFFNHESFNTIKELFHSSVIIDSSGSFCFSNTIKQLGRIKCNGGFLMEFLKKCINVFSKTKGIVFIEKCLIYVSNDSVGFIPTGIIWSDNNDLLPLDNFLDLIRFIQSRQIDMKFTEIHYSAKLKEYSNCETWEQLVYFSKEFEFSRFIFYYAHNPNLAPPNLKKNQIDCELIRIKSSHSF